MNEADVRMRRGSRHGFLVLAGVILLAMAVPLATGGLPGAGAAVTPGLVGAWGFDEGTGTTVGDASGNGNIGSITAATWAPTGGRFGGALSFNGANSLVTITDAAGLHLTTGATLEAWVNPATVVDWRVVMMKERPSGLSYALYGATASVSHAAAYVNTGGSDESSAGTAALPVGAWSHVAMTYDGSMLRTFVNGAQVGSTAVSGSMVSSTGALRIGGDSIWGEWFSGLIDEVRIYNRALSSTEINTDMTTPVGAPAPPDTSPPTAPANLAATAGAGQASLSWTAAADNIGVAAYDVYRSTSPGFTPSAATKIAATTATSFVDTGLAATTYYYAVVARDAAGNNSPPSNTTSVTVSAPPAGRPGLVGAWGFDEGTGTLAGDSSGQANTGTVAATTWSPSGKFGKALSFNGTSSMVSIPDSASLHLATGATLEAWVNPSSVSGWRATVLKERPGGMSYGLYAATTGATTAAGYVNTGGSDQGARGGSALPANAWTHVAVTYDGSIVRLLVNGTQVATQAATGSITTSADPLRIGGDTIWGEWFAGQIDEVRVYNRALSGAEITGDMTTPIGTPPPPDSIAPSAPTNVGATGGSGQAALSWTASTDNVGVAGYDVHRATTSGFTPSAATRIAAVATTTYTDTGLAAGTYYYRVVARDGAGNTSPASAQAAAAVTAPPDDPRSLVGAWTAPTDMPEIGQQMVLLRSGKVLYFPSGDSAGVLDPSTGQVTPVPNNTTNLFCAGQTLLPDGRVITVGGDVAGRGAIGIPDTNIFDPATNTWTRVANMHNSRWYPDATVLKDGRILSVSGSNGGCLTCFVQTPEVYDPAANTWTTLPTAANNIPYYPFLYTLTDGRIVQVGATEQATSTQVLDTNTWTWSTVDPRVIDAGSSTQYRPGKILKAGTSSDGGYPSDPSSPNAYVIDMNQPSPAWRQTTSMANPRAFLNLTMMPDGNVLSTGGGTTKDGQNVNNAVKVAESWSPATEAWTTLAAMQTPRLYHSTAMLLPDGRVLVAGSGNDAGVVDQRTYEIYSPPYLFKGARPTIASAPAAVRPGDTFSVTTPDASRIASLALIRPAAVTHAYDGNTNFQQLSFTTSGSTLTVQAPANGNLMPPGDYMLFALDNNGVPSVASWVRAPLPSAPAPDTTPPAAVTNLVGTGGAGQASLTWNAATDNVGVAGYDLHRATTAGFMPTPATRIAQPTGTSYTDTGLTAGTYYYKVVARDAAGNLGPASNQATVAVTAPPTQPGLVGAWGFNEGSGTIVGDASGSANNGSAANTTWAPTGGHFGGALTFNGTSSMVTVPGNASLDMTTAVTMEAWVKPATVSGWRTVMLKERPNGLSYATYGGTPGTSTAAGFINTGGSDIGQRSGPTLPLNTWSHVAVTYDGANLRLFVNGAQVGSSATSGPIVTSTGALRFGGSTVWGEWFSGSIDDARLYRRALSPAEITTDMNTAVGP